MTIQSSFVEYEDGGETMQGCLAIDSGHSKPVPVVLIAHAWAGQGEIERNKAVALAELGYAGFAVDLYGKGRRGNSVEENAALMTPLMQDRARVVRGMNAALDIARGLDGIDKQRVAAIGFCFGGLCALDLARSGADISGVVSFHGLFEPSPLPTSAIKAKVLALHGWDDPMVSHEQVVALGQELTAAGADWQMHAYGNTMHAFSNPNANDVDLGTVYNAVADRRSWLAMQNFLSEVFGG